MIKTVLFLSKHRFYLTLSRYFILIFAEMLPDLSHIPSFNESSHRKAGAKALQT